MITIESLEERISGRRERNDYDFCRAYLRKHSDDMDEIGRFGEHLLSVQREERALRNEALRECASTLYQAGMRFTWKYALPIAGVASALYMAFS